MERSIKGRFGSYAKSSASLIVQGPISAQPRRCSVPPPWRSAMGHEEQFSPTNAEHPLCDQTGDLRRDALQWARCAVSSHSWQKAIYASVRADFARCSTNRRACAGRRSRPRTQTISCRIAHLSVSRSMSSAIVRRQRRAAVSGTTATPTPYSTMRHTESRPRRRIRIFRDRPRRADCHARCSASALPATRPTNSSSSTSTNAMSRRPANG